MKTWVCSQMIAWSVVIALCPFAVQAGDGQVSAAEVAAAVTPTSASSVDPGPAPASPPDPVPTSATDAASDTRIMWQGDPIPIGLKVQVEQRIDFPEPIAEISVPREIEQHSRIVLTPTGHLHWTANTPFASTRVLATSVSGSLYQLDVTARPDGVASGRIVLNDPVLDAAALAKAHTPDDRAKREQAAAQLIPKFLQQGAGAPSSDKPSYVTLSRFALAHFTGPRRLIPQLDAIRVAVRPMKTQAWLRVQSSALTLQPLAQWKAGDRYVTVLGALNRSAAEIAFDPRAFRGDVLFAAALHPTLGPRGSGHNQSVWVVITSQPFNRAFDHGTALSLDR